MIITGTINSVRTAIEHASQITRNGLAAGEIETEPTFTDRMIGAFKTVVEANPEYRGYKFGIRTLRDRGPGAAEHEFGADFCAVLKVEIEDFSIEKGFLAQAKLSGRGGVSVRAGGPGVYSTVMVSATAGDRTLRAQCDQMLAVTPDSYVVVYDYDDILVVPASSVAHLHHDAGTQPLYSKSIGNFFSEFLMSFVGDPALKAHDDQSLRELRDRTGARTAFLLSISEVASAQDS